MVATKKPKRKAKPKGKPPVNGQVIKFLPPWETGNAGAPTENPWVEDEGEAYDWSYVHPKTAAIRRLFVAEYVKDFNGANAVLRMGLRQYADPRIIACLWLREPFTQHVLDSYVRETEERALITRNSILAGLVREANAYGLDSSGASRVSALSKLAKILGLEITKVEGEVKVAGGVMLVPAGTSLDDWEKMATASQTKLKAEAKQ